MNCSFDANPTTHMRSLKAKVKASQNLYTVVEFVTDYFVRAKSYYGDVITFAWDEVELVECVEDI